MKKILAVVTGLSFTCMSGAFAGVTFKQITREEGQRTTTETQVWVDGGAARIEYLQFAGAEAFFPPGSYMVLKPEGMFLVKPSERTFTRFDMSALQGMGQAFAGADTGIETSDVVVEKLLEEDGGTIEGYPTRHYQFKTSYTMTIGGAMRTSYESLEDVWVTDAIDAGAAFKPGGVDAMPLPGFAQGIAEAEAKKAVEGFPLKQVAVQSAKSDVGGLGGLGGRLAARAMNRVGGGATTTVMETKEIQITDVPAAMFEIPADYREVDLLQSGPALPSLNNLGN